MKNNEICMGNNVLYDNWYLGDNELVIRYTNGTHVVYESYESYNIVFSGSYVNCQRYCQKRWIDYQESIIG